MRPGTRPGFRGALALALGNAHGLGGGCRHSRVTAAIFAAGVGGANRDARGQEEHELVRLRRGHAHGRSALPVYTAQTEDRTCPQLGTTGNVLHADPQLHTRSRPEAEVPLPHVHVGGEGGSPITQPQGAGIV